MQALQMTFSLPRYVLTRLVGALNRQAYYGPLAMLRYREVPDPQLPGPEWVRIRTVYGGICGSDLHTLMLQNSPSLSAFSSFPFVLGHENVGAIDEVGAAISDLTFGERVVAEPLLGCTARGFSEPCEYCARGEIALCRNFSEGKLKPGLGIGNCADTGGSWGEYFVAHRSQVFRVPANVSDEAAVLTEPLSVAIHAVQRGLPSDSQTVVVVGAGVIGQCIIAALRAAGCHARIIVLAKYAFQAEMARRMGASEALTGRGEGVIPEIARLTAGKLYRPIIGPRVLVGGADVTYECVGSAASIDQSLRITRGGGRVVLAGLAHKAESVDWTPIWLKELNLQGTFWSGTSSQGDHTLHDTELALQWMAAGAVDMSPLLTHTFTLDEYRQALTTTLHRGRSGVLKSAFRY